MMIMIFINYDIEKDNSNDYNVSSKPPPPPKQKKMHFLRPEMFDRKLQLLLGRKYLKKHW